MFVRKLLGNEFKARLRDEFTFTFNLQLIYIAFSRGRSDQIHVDDWILKLEIIYKC